MKSILIIILCLFTTNIFSQENYKDDPMPKEEWRKLPKPYLLMEVSPGCYCPMLDSVFITFGPNKDNICEVWLISVYRKYEEIWEAYNDAKRPERAWIGQYSWRDFNKWKNWNQ